MPITPLPPPPSRTVPDTFADLGDAFLGALPTFATEMEDARQTAATAVAAAPAAVAAANYKGDYSAGTTYQIGQSVSYGGYRWYAKTVNTGVTPVIGANWGQIIDIPALGGNAGKYLTTDGTSALWGNCTLRVYLYDSRASLRSLTPNAGEMVVVEELGLFVWEAGSTEPDDDESCFATATGAWLLYAAAWPLIEAWSTPETEMLERFTQEQEGWNATQVAFNNTVVVSSRILSATASSSITSVNSLAMASFTATVTGAAVGDRVVATPPDALNPRISVFARVTSENTVTVYLNNPSASSASIATGTWKITVIKS